MPLLDGPSGRGFSSAGPAGLDHVPSHPASNTDQVLKARKTSSASVRRRKFQERQQQHALEQEKLAEHKKLRRFDQMTDASAGSYTFFDDDDDLDVDPDPVCHDRESSIETPSDRSAPTPDDPRPQRAVFGKPAPLAVTKRPLLTPIKIHVPREVEVPMDVDDPRLLVPPSPRPVLQASLATLSDIRYDRYSCMVESPVSEAPESESEADETFSPIETATPVAFRQPKARPSLISIGTMSSHEKRKTASLPSPLSQTVSQTSLLDRPVKRQSTSSSSPGFPAAEATELRIPDLPTNAFQLIANASHESLPLSMRESTVKAERTHGVPRLSIALNHTRVSSIKSLVKTPTSATHSRTYSRPTSHVSRPSTASLSGADLVVLKNRRADAANGSRSLSATQRPQTAKSPVSAVFPSMTAPPSLPTPPADDMADPMHRKKSFSTLRRRSESIGQAIKGLTKMGGKQHAAPGPHSPTFITSKRPPPLDLANFPSPPLPSPRTGKSSAASFTSSLGRGHGGGNFGLGLGLSSVEGLSPR